MTPLTIKSTFLGAHAVPLEYRGKQTEYVDLVINEILPQVALEGLADYIDVFCDKGFFTVEDTARILEAGLQFGMQGKIHANELDYSGGVQVGVKYNALSVDHLEYVGDAEIEALKGSKTMPTILPGAAFFLGMVYAPARKMIDAGLPVAINTAYAMNLSDKLGSIAVGKIANLFITKEIPSIEFMPYAFGSNKVETVILNGEVVKR